MPQIHLSSDELILGLISLVLTINPRMLRQSPNGFSVDFAGLENQTDLGADEQLLLKFRAPLEDPMQESSAELDLSVQESQRLGETLLRLETLQPWSPDVLALSRGLRARLAPIA